MKAPLFLCTRDKLDYAIAETLSRRADKEDDYDEFDRSMLQNTTIEQEIVYTALKIRNDLEQSPGYSGGWHDISQESVNIIIPASLYTFLSVLLGGTTAIDDPDSVNKARHVMFQKGKKALEMFPPNKDALECHIFRANYQAKIWLQATTRNMDVGSLLETGGWTQAENGLKSQVESHPFYSYGIY
ncbi:hypothetical protein SK128_006157 [Halocaridina rubra]|uniref:Uncharacterized protein n=1 Tax=Halocaridina rubra TaxID=373956 RepID=A0AAN9ABM3_HALRR